MKLSTRVQALGESATLAVSARAKALIASGVSDAIGRKKTMIFAGLLFAVSAIGKIVTEYEQTNERHSSRG